MQVTFVLLLEFALSKSDVMASPGLTTFGFQDDMTFIGSAAALNHSWNDIEGTQPDAGRLGLNSLRAQSCRRRFGISV